MLYVDASWKNKKELAGVGWSLHRREGTQHIQGSSSIQATNSSLEAEAQALSMAVEETGVSEHCLHDRQQVAS